MKITSQRILTDYQLAKLCMGKNWYTNGNCAEYEQLLDNTNNLNNVNDNQLYSIAQNIIAHSVDLEQDIAGVMFELNKIAHTFYDVDCKNKKRENKNGKSIVF